MDILDFLTDSDVPFISYNDLSLSVKEFKIMVNAFAGMIRDSVKGQKKSLLIGAPDPVRFYAFLFAIWKTDNIALFPIGENYKGEDAAVAEYIINIENKKPHIEETGNKLNINLGDGVDTIIFSSGTTGKPKGILHNRNNFLRNAEAVQKVCSFNGHQSITPLLPHLVSAVSHAVVHLMTGSHLIFTDFSNTNDISGILAEKRSCSIVGSPLHVTALASMAGSENKPPLVFSSGDFLLPSAIRDILNRFPYAKIYKVYGLTELAGRFFIKEIDSSTEESEYEDIGIPLEGVTYDVHQGELFCKSSFMFSGYLTGNGIETAQRPHPTGDFVDQHKNMMTIVGRGNTVLKVGGRFISLADIEERITGVLGGDIPLLVPRKHPVAGTILCLCLVTEKRSSRKELVDKLRSVLDKSEMPHEYRYLGNISYTDSMKIDRNRIANDLENLEVIL